MQGAAVACATSAVDARYPGARHRHAVDLLCQLDDQAGLGLGTTDGGTNGGEASAGMVLPTTPGNVIAGLTGPPRSPAPAIRQQIPSSGHAYRRKWSMILD